MGNITFSEGSGLGDTVFGRWQAPIRKMIVDSAEAFEQESMLPYIYNMGKSKKWAESYSGLTAMQNWLPVGENGEHPVNGFQEGYKKIIEHEVWKSTFSISREMADDDTNGVLKEPVKFTNAWFRTREQHGADLLGHAIKGETSFVKNGKRFDTRTADEVCLFSRAHPNLVDKKTQSNLFADEFSNDALLYMETAMQCFKGDTGEILDVRPTTIIAPTCDPMLKKKILEAVGSDLDPNSANNAVNINAGRWRIIFWSYLNRFVPSSGNTPWILLAEDYNKMYSGAEWLDRVEMEVTSERASNDANKWDGYARFGAGFVDWRAFAVGGVTGGTQLIAST